MTHRLRNALQMLSDNMFVTNQTRYYDHVLRQARASRDIGNRFPEEIAMFLLVKIPNCSANNCACF